MRILVFFVSVSVSVIGESKIYRYRLSIDIGLRKISVSVVSVKLKSSIAVIGFLKIGISIGFQISAKPISVYFYFR